jgi:hypothetical protein
MGKMGRRKYNLQSFEVYMKKSSIGGEGVRLNRFVAVRRRVSFARRATVFRVGVALHIRACPPISAFRTGVQARDQWRRASLEG